ncbi:phage holin family protein [Peribacillus loiseleuriae]|uniref:phage holin family protein n=1 Tax=Peribacillus loiseleuriae TaxID=1679170 RepID=UPI000670D05F|nr:phage holin family protein [Peribacillus loiseleuriae]
MNFDVLEQYIQPEVFILIPVIYLIGLFLRQTPHIPIWLHAWIQLVVADIACAFIIGNNVNAFIQAVLVTGASHFLKDLIQHTVYGLKGIEQDPNTGQFITKKDVDKS